MHSCYVFIYLGFIVFTLFSVRKGKRVGMNKLDNVAQNGIKYIVGIGSSHDRVFEGLCIKNFPLILLNEIKFLFLVKSKN